MGGSRGGVGCGAGQGREGRKEGKNGLVGAEEVKAIEI